MLKRVLVALDGSPASYAALGEGVRWAGLVGAQLRGVFVEDEQRFVYVPAISQIEGGVPVSVPLPEEEHAAMEAAVREEGEAIRGRFEAAVSAGTGVHTEFVTSRGDVNVLLVAEARSVDLVVMGKRGKWDGESPRSAGPTTEALIHEALRPVLVVPAQSCSDGPILFAYDGSKGVQRVVVPAACMISLLGAPSVVLTVSKDQEEAEHHQKTLVRYLEAYNLSTRLLVREGRAAPVIVETAEELKAGMIVMGAFGHNPLRELLFGSTTMDVLARTPCPVLLMV